MISSLLAVFSDSPHLVERAGVLRALIRAKADYAREAKGVTALVPGAGLNLVERHLDHDHRLDQAHPAEILDGVSLEPLCHLCDLGISQARVCLAHIQQLALGPQYRKRVVR